MKRLSCVALASAFTFLAAAAHADEDIAPVAPEASPPPTASSSSARGSFGKAGTVVLDDMIGFGVIASGGLGVGGGSLGALALPTGWLRFSNTKSDGENGGMSREMEFALTPTFDVFMAERVSLGTQVILAHARVRGGYEASVLSGGIRPRVGYVFALTEDLSLWTRAFAEIDVSHATTHYETGDAKSTSVRWGVGADAMFVAPVGRSVALTFGPTLAYGKVDLVDSAPSSGWSTISMGVRGGIALVL